MDIFKLVGRVMVDSRDAQDSIAKTDSKALGMAKTLGKGITTAAKWGAALAGAATTAAVAISKQAIEAYAEYEQLVGGVETLFKTSSDKVMEYAENAYKTAGLSANEYMESVTSFSASLLASLDGDTAKAAKYADRAITDMADNANKMGTDIKSIQTAYQGFAKQNYTMLDNLKLGYGGTKTEMERLIKDASRMKDVQQKLGVTVDESSLSFANIVNAISVVQSSMGIMGATAEEASTTIEGSVNAMKSAWKNLLVGIADDNADFKTLVNNFVDSAITAGDNLIPRLETVLDGLGTLITTGSETILPKVIDILMDNLPSLIDAGINLALALLDALFDPENVYKTIYGAIDLLLSVTESISDAANSAEGQNAIDALGSAIARAIWDAIKKHFVRNREKFYEQQEEDYGINSLFSQIRSDGKHASGLTYVPYDGYVAELHRGEMVVPANKANEMRSDSGNDNNEYLLRQILDCLKSSQTININNREFGRLVRGVQ